MRPFQVSEKAWMTEYYQSAIGLTIVGVEWLEEVDMGPDATGNPLMVKLDYYEQMPGLICTAPEGHPLHGTGPIRLDISRDEEGNGRGFLFGLIQPPPIPD